MKIAAFIIVALFAYLISGVNPAIILSNLIYHKDIRKEGSGNPGFTNFKRAFGHKYAWWVFVLDFLKGIVVSVVAGILFKQFVSGPVFGLQITNYRILGVAYACIFGMLGHSFPVWYKFKGGKGFLFCMSTLFFLNPWVGLISFSIMVALLLTTKYMSLATCAALFIGAAILPVPVFGVQLLPTGMYALCVLYMIVRHKENFKRLFKGVENKTYIFKK